MGKGQNIVVIDYGMGNIGSIINMFKFLGVQAKVSSDKETISRADKLVLPGVGHFDKAMENIGKLSLLDTIQDMALLRKVPFLGICLGMQLMCKRSDEGVLPGLSLINAEVNKFVFPFHSKLKVPHMGWNYVDVKKQSEVLEGIDNQSRFYFVHSYFVSCNSDSDVLTKTTYDSPFVSAFERDNLIGVQFHPEKSHRYGITLFKNFIDKI
jgi:glutamine amidotransferase